MAISTLLSLGWSSQLLIDRRQSSSSSPKALDAVTPCGSSCQPITLTQSATSAAIACMYSAVPAEASRRRARDEIGSDSASSLQARPESMSEEGTGSRRPWLPSESQANSAGGGPSESIPISIIFRISESATAEITALIWPEGSSALCRAITVELSRLAASCSSCLLVALAISRRSSKGARVSAATRSMPTITPRISDREEKTGTCRMS